MRQQSLNNTKVTFQTQRNGREEAVVLEVGATLQGWPRFEFGAMAAQIGRCGTLRLV